MKRTAVILIALIFVLAGCSPAPATTAGTASPTGQTTNEGYVFKINGLTIAMHAEVTPILAQLGKEKSYFEAESCAFQGMEKQYAYSSFSLYTYELDGIDRVASIVINDDSISTPESIYLNSSLEEVLAAYGEQYTKSLGLYSYEKGKMKLSILIENDKVVSIEYVALS